jgi:hypothetical protein
MRKVLLAGVLCFGLISSTVFASPINLPTGIKGQDGVGLISNLPVGLSAGFLNDYVGERDLNKNSGKASFDMIGGIIDLSILNRFDVYTMLGSMQSPEIKGTGYTLNFSDDFMWGVGADAVIYDWKAPGIQFFGDGNFREANSLGLDSFTYNGTTYNKSQFNSVLTANGKWEEWQAALGVSKKFEYVIPYGGIVYSDVKTSGKVSVLGKTVSGSANSKNKVGPFVGVSIIPTKWLSIDITGRFVAEEAVSVAATVKF